MRLRLPDGRRKRLSVREAARLQSFPDWFKFAGSESSKVKQIGNAVPPLLAFNLGCSLLNALESPLLTPEELSRMDTGSEDQLLRVKSGE